MKLEFKPEDFGGLAREYWFPEMLERANARLAEMLKDAPVIEGYERHGVRSIRISDPHLTGKRFTARLIEIEEVGE